MQQVPCHIQVPVQRTATLEQEAHPNTCHCGCLCMGVHPAAQRSACIVPHACARRRKVSRHSTLSPCLGPGRPVCAAPIDVPPHIESIKDYPQGPSRDFQHCQQACSRAQQDLMMVQHWRSCAATTHLTLHAGDHIRSLGTADPRILIVAIVKAVVPSSIASGSAMRAIECEVSPFCFIPPASCVPCRLQA